MNNLLAENYFLRGFIQTKIFSINHFVCKKKRKKKAKHAHHHFLKHQVTSCFI